MEHFFSYLTIFDEFLWSAVAIPLIVLLGVLLSIRFQFVQIFRFKEIVRSFIRFSGKSGKEETRGVEPLKVFFASIGGCIGIGNIVAVCTAVQIGGPGAIFWMWVAALLGMVVKYSEVYLGIKYRVENESGGYNGGPMYYLQKVVKSTWVPILFAVLLGIYGTEIYMFSVITHSVSENWNLNPYFIIISLLVLILYASKGGIARVGKISGVILPVFLLLFGGMSLWILLVNFSNVPNAFLTIFRSAFTGHAPMGAFVGSGIVLAMSQGIARGCYTGDIGIGYAGVVSAETQLREPEKQAQLSILGIFFDTFIVCTLTTLIILVTGVWNQEIPASLVLQRAFETYFPLMNLFMPLFIFFLGFSTLIAFFAVGLKCASFIHPKRGEMIYYIYASLAFIAFSFIGQETALLVMSLSGAMLLIINLFGIYRLRKEIRV